MSMKKTAFKARVTRSLCVLVLFALFNLIATITDTPLAEIIQTITTFTLIQKSNHVITAQGNHGLREYSRNFDQI